MFTLTITDTETGKTLSITADNIDEFVKTRLFQRSKVQILIDRFKKADDA